MENTTLAKIAITESADQALAQALVQVNTGFLGGRITKTDLSSWLITNAAAKLDDRGIDEIRRAHFNQVVYLEALVKKLKGAGQDNLRAEDVAALQALLGQQTMKKKSPQTKADDTAVASSAASKKSENSS